MGADSGPDSGPRFAASYARNSVRAPISIEDQHRINEACAAGDGWLIPPGPEYRYEDDDTTGVATERSGLSALVDRVRTGTAPFARVYVKDVTRLGRWDPRYGIWLEWEMERAGVTLRFVEEPTDIDFAHLPVADAFAPLMRRLMDRFVAAEERERLIRRVRTGMRDRARRGYWVGGTAPYATVRWLASLETGHLIEPILPGRRVRRDGCAYRLAWDRGDPYRVVGDIFALIASGSSLARVASILTGRGTPSPGLTARWSPEAVRRIAHNALYKGDLVWGSGSSPRASPAHPQVPAGDPLVVRGYLPDPPVEPALFDAVQRILTGNRAAWRQRRASSPNYLLSGLVRCAVCDAGWHGHTSSRSERRRRRYYRHGQGGDCPHAQRYLPADPTEAGVRTFVLQRLAARPLIRAWAEAWRDHHSATAAPHTRDLELVTRDLVRKRSALDRAVRDRAHAEDPAERAACARLIDTIAGEMRALEARILELEDDLEIRTRRMGESPAAPPLGTVFKAASGSVATEIVAALVAGVVVDPAKQTIKIRSRPLAVDG